MGKLPQLSEFHQQAVKEQTRPDLLNAEQRAVLAKFAHDAASQRDYLHSSQPVVSVTKQQVQKCLLFQTVTPVLTQAVHAVLNATVTTAAI